MKPTFENYNALIRRVDNYTRQAIREENAGNMELAQAFRKSARHNYEMAEELAKQLPVKGKKKPARNKDKKPRTPIPPRRSNSKLAVSEMLAGIFRGVEKATGKNFATETLQYSTTPEECKQWLQTVKAMFTDRKGKLNKTEYCNALNYTRDNILFTVCELKNAIETAQKYGNTGAVPGYKVMIERDEANAEMIAKEIEKNGGTVH